MKPLRRDAPPPAVDVGIDASGKDHIPSLEVLFRANFDRLVRVVSLITDDASDAVQDAFVEAYRRWDEVSAYDDPLTWLRRVALNKARDRARRRRRERVLVPLLGIGTRKTATSSSQGDRLHVRSAIERLPGRQQLAVVLFYIGDLSVAEVARVMNVSDGSVKASLHAARKNLLPLLEVADDTR